MKIVQLVALLFVVAVPALAVDRIEPGDLSYAGSFALPKWRPGVRWGYGTTALTYDADADALVGSAHVHFCGQVAWCSIPEVGGQSVDVRPFVDVRGALASRPEFTIDVPRLDGHGGLAIVDGRLWASFFTSYAVQSFAQLDKPSFVSNSLTLDDARGLYKVGPYGDPVFGQKRTSNYLFAIPREWADAHVGGKRLGAGKGNGAGNAGNSHGPPIYAVGTEPDADGVLPAVALVHYPPNGGHFPWSPCDVWEGAVWVRGAVLIAGRRGLGEKCYGTPAECNNGCEGGKGYHCDPYGVDMLFYDEDDLARSARGEVQPHEVMPYETANFTPLFEATCHKRLGGMAYDERRSRLYLVQQNGESGVVHVWDIERTEQPPAPPVTHRVRVAVDDREATFESESRVTAVAEAIEYLSRVLRE